MPKILIIEDDPETAEAVSEGLSAAGHVVEWVDNSLEGLQRLSIYDYELVVLDWNLGEESGLELCKAYRQKGGRVPILMLTGRAELENRVSGLEGGADDYLTKPFAIRELNARVTAVLRRPIANFVSLKRGGLELEPSRGVAIRNGEEIQLRALELAVLEFLMRSPDQFFSANDLLNRVWSSESESTEEAVRKTINRIRQKLDVGDQSYIVSVKNQGYKFALPEDRLSK